MDKLKNLYGLIFAGGGGTRLWPLSTEGKPKQFLKLFSDKTLLQETLKRVNTTVPFERIYVITTAMYRDEVARNLPQIKDEQIIIEPNRKNTGSAAFLGLLVIKKENPKAIVANVWADHKIDNVEEYNKALKTAAVVASSGKWLVTTGIAPTFPHTGLGYIKTGERIQNDNGIVWKVVRFIEKPDIKRAEDMLDEGGYLWNVGLYVWEVDAALDAFRRFTPEIAKYEGEIMEALEFNNFETIAKVYDGIPEMSIDKAVSEKADNLVVVKGEFDWSDIGDFEVLWEKISEKDEDGNAILGKGGNGWVGINTQGGMFVSESGQTIATYGLENMVVVATKDAVLVVPKGDAQKVKELVTKIRESGKNNVL